MTITSATEAIARLLIVPGMIELLAPAHHGGDEKTGSTPVLRTITQWSPSLQRHVRLPFISGNSIRGQLRRLAMQDMLRRLGYELKSRTLYYSLFSGGVLTSTEEDEGVLDLELRRQIRAHLPVVSLFGCAIGNQNLDGCLKVENAMPICHEYAPYLRPELQSDPRASLPVATFIDFSYFSRRDDIHLQRDEGEQAVQMLVTFEVLIPGTAFQHGFALEWPSELEASAFHHVLSLWGERLHVGGRAATGHGLARAVYDTSSLPSPEVYCRFLQSERDKICHFLSELETRFP
jgi:hypothetical protein